MEENRIYFKDEVLRKGFFIEIKKENSLTLKGLAEMLNTSKSIVDKYLSGELTFPKSRFFRLLNLLSDERKNYYFKKTEKIDCNWGRRKGGGTTYSKYPELAKKARLKAIEKNQGGKYKVDINLPLSLELCEFIGAFIGDGFMNKYGCSYIVQFTGDGNLDKQYHNDVLVAFIYETLKLKPTITIKDNTLRLTMYSKNLIKLLHDRFGFPLGKKCYTVKIPAEILCAENRFIARVLRGIFDTDGCVFFDKRKIYAKPYLRICLGLENEGLIQQIHELLHMFGINSRITNNSKRIQINGVKQVKLFLEKIGFSNERHLSKLKPLAGFEPATC